MRTIAESIAVLEKWREQDPCYYWCLDSAYVDFGEPAYVYGNFTGVNIEGASIQEALDKAASEVKG